MNGVVDITQPEAIALSADLGRHLHIGYTIFKLLYTTMRAIYLLLNLILSCNHVTPGPQLRNLVYATPQKIGATYKGLGIFKAA